MHNVRSIEVFNPAVNDWKYGIIGAGAIGSKVAIHLAELGIEDIIVYDYDVIEQHNVGNQAYNLAQIGESKVDALKKIVMRKAGIDIEAVNGKFEEKIEDSVEMYNSIKECDVVFMCVDSLSARKFLIKNLHEPMYLIDTRMGVMHGDILVSNFDSCYEKMLEHLDTPKEEQTSGCGSPLTLGTISSTIAAIAVNQMILALNGIPFKEVVELRLDTMEMHYEIL